ncbi:hypothetical protein GCM10009612_67390 [Streptomyces beijiangensis]
MIAMTALHANPLFARLENADHILVAGAGGGFDIYAGLPVALSLMHQGKDVHLANLSFSAVEGLPIDAWLAPDVAVVTPDTAPHQTYFPERTLAQWLALHDYPSTVHALARVGVQPLRAAYRALIDRYDIDAVVLVDGGTDILMRGDESGLGTPEEDLTSVAALAGLDVPESLIVSIGFGFGVDAYHGGEPRPGAGEHRRPRTRRCLPRRLLRLPYDQGGGALRGRGGPRPAPHARPPEHRQRLDSRRGPGRLR